MKLTLKLFYRNNLSQVNVSNLFFTPKGFEPIFEANLNYYIHSLIKAKNLRLIFVKYFVYPMWDDVRTYLATEIDPQVKSALLIAISHFKRKEGN